MIPLTRDMILNATDLPKEEVPVPEWNGTVWVKTLAGAERDAFEIAMTKAKTRDGEANLQNIRARLAVLTVADYQGNRIFKDEDADALGKKSAKALDRIFAVAQRLNGFRAEDVEELAKNSGSVPSDASGSNSATDTLAPSPSSNG